MYLMPFELDNLRVKGGKHSYLTIISKLGTKNFLISQKLNFSNELKLLGMSFII